MIRRDSAGRIHEYTHIYAAQRFSLLYVNIFPCGGRYLAFFCPPIFSVSLSLRAANKFAYVRTCISERYVRLRREVKPSIAGRPASWQASRSAGSCLPANRIGSNRFPQYPDVGDGLRVDYAPHAYECKLRTLIERSNAPLSVRESIDLISDLMGIVIT